MVTDRQILEAVLSRGQRILGLEWMDLKAEWMGWIPVWMGWIPE